MFAEALIVTEAIYDVRESNNFVRTYAPHFMTDSAPPPRIFFEPMNKFTPPLPNSTTDLLLSQVLHPLKCCNTAALLDLTAEPKVIKV